jgi:hypothetical protein
MCIPTPTAGLPRLAIQGLRFACPWLPSCIPNGMRSPVLERARQLFQVEKASEPLLFIHRSLDR